MSGEASDSSATIDVVMRDIPGETLALKEGKVQAPSETVKKVISKGSSTGVARAKQGTSHVKNSCSLPSTSSKAPITTPKNVFCSAFFCFL